jgi:Na+-driven multidrug efflux pump
VGEQIGRRTLDAVWPTVRMTATAAAAWMSFVSAWYLVAPATIVGLFQAHDAAPDAPGGSLVELGATMLALSVGWQLFDAAASTLSETLRAAGDTVFCMLARIVLAWFLFVPAAVGLSHWGGGGAKSMMLCLTGYIVALAVTFSLRFASGRWRNIDLTGVGTA